MITISVQGEPRPKQSFRYAKTGGYTSAKVKAWQETVAWEANIVMRSKSFLEGYISVTMDFRLGNNRRVDLDNLSKAVLDAMNGIVYKDDTEVIELHLKKMVVKDNPGVIVGIEILET